MQLRLIGRAAPGGAGAALLAAVLTLSRTSFFGGLVAWSVGVALTFGLMALLYNRYRRVAIATERSP